ncbi:MAG: HAMP domain-containing histidine kinase [Oscillospiraceae bacterium]|nr:HAMP domain-containing histidine kinase [Oscillospiraceae bacterium]
MLPWALAVLAALLAAALAVRLYLLHRDLDALGQQLARRLTEDTNNLLFLPTRDRHVRRLAAQLGRQLQVLRQARLRYENGDRALKEAVANVSHDLRTPLTAICGYLELLEQEKPSPAAARYLRFIGERTRAMRELTEALLRYSLTLSAEEPLHPEAVDLNAALEQSVAALYGALRERQITPEVRLPEARVVRQLDRAALERVLENLLGNAVKYSAGDLEIVLTEAGAMMFSNTAPGLDEVQVGKLFDRFFTVETGRHGTGLGLSIAKALAERMGGVIGARYENGRLRIDLSFPA